MLALHLVFDVEQTGAVPDSGGASASAGGLGWVYRQRRPEETVLYQVVAEQLQTLLAMCEEAGRPLPAFVEAELRSYLACGIPARGVVRVRCSGCGFDRLVPLSCKTKSICPSCLGRWMALTAADLVDRVIPRVPMRQWVLTVPPPIRYLLAYDRELISVVLARFIRAVERCLVSKAHHHWGLDEGAKIQPGSVTVIQRSGSALNLNVHFHSLITDGVFVRTHLDETPTFYALPPPSAVDLEEVAWEVCWGTTRVLGRKGLWEDTDTTGVGAGDDELALEEPTLAALSRASVNGYIAMGDRAGKRLLRLGVRTSAADDGVGIEHGSGSATQLPAYGFDLHAGRRVAGHDKKGLERMCRYILRPPVANERLRRLDDGSVSLRLTHAWRDGTTNLVMSPLELMQRLVPLIWPPGFNRIRYHGVFAPNARMRPDIVPRTQTVEAGVGARASCSHSSQQPGAGRGQEAKRGSWAWLLARVFQIEILRCPKCGDAMQQIAVIVEQDSLRRILDSVGLPADSPEVRPAAMAGQLDLAFYDDA